jgi:hypothetical protein
MAPYPLDATPGSPAANTYATLAEARDYYARHLYATNPDQDDDDKLSVALVQATQLIEEGYVWYGRTASLAQRLAWPRYRMEMPNQRGYWLSSTTIPDRLKDATAELARQLLAGDTTAENKVEAQGIESLSVDGAVSIRFTGRGGRKVLPSAVTDKLSLWGYLRNERGVRRLERA